MIENLRKRRFFARIFASRKDGVSYHINQEIQGNSEPVYQTFDLEIVGVD